MNARIVLRIFMPLLFMLLAAGAVRGQGRVQRITLDQAVQLFLANNLELQDRELEIEKARGERATAGLWANPAVSFSREDVSLGDLDYSEDVIGLEYEFDLFGKRGLRKSAADYGVAVAESQFAHDRTSAIAELKRTYVLAVLAKSRVELLEQTADVFESAVTTGKARLEEGDISGFDQMRLGAEGARYRRELVYAQVEYQALQGQLGVLISPAGEAALFEPADDLAYSPWGLNLEQSLETALRERPDLKRMEYAVRASHETVRFAKREMFPAVSLFGGYKSQSDDFTGSAIGVSLSLPVFDRNQGNVAVARAELLQLERRKALLERQARAQVETAFARVKALESQLQHLDEDRRTDTGEILEIAQAAYAEGEMSLLELLDAAEANYDAQFARRELQADYMIGLIELESAVGGSIKE